MSDLAAITCLFSYVKNDYIAKRHRQFRRKLEKQGVELFTIELAFFDEEYLLKEEDTYLRLRTNTVLWHKETLLNILVKRLPPRIKKIAWLDCDIFIEDDNWAEEASELLDKHTVVQLGRKHLYLNKQGQIERTHMTLGYGLHHGSPDWNNYAKHHPGLGWVSSRDLFSKYGGLFEYGLSGGGDGMMGYIFANGTGGDPNDMKNWVMDWKLGFYSKHSPTIIDKLKDYKDRVAPYVNGSVSYLDSRVFHGYHAPQRRRGYASRPKVLSGIDFHKDLLKDKNGLFKWKDMRYNLVFEKFFSMKDSQENLKKNISYDEVNIENIL
ncbi:hypothetical protein CMI37_22255 [Candidatus Pacearchaeota archaeon]|nr:hypothetical protein [Candidatus Pacearchaeota archaeon]|tara:strand:- start:25604 stop:26572 length:969 start_codon:yes stop_codon:yes gene_type:complete